MDSSEEEGGNNARKSAPAVTHGEKSVLFALIGANPEVENKKTQFGTTSTSKLIAWDKIASQFNSQPNCTKRTGTQLKTWWGNQKKRAKKNVTTQKKLIRKTGGGPKPPELLPDTEKVLSIVPCQLTSLQNEFDCDEEEMEQDEEVRRMREDQSITIIPVEGDEEQYDVLPQTSNMLDSGTSNKKKKRRDARSTLVDFEYEEHKLRLKTLNTEFETALLKKSLIRKQIEFSDAKSELELQNSRENWN